MRLVPNQDPKRLQKLVKAFVDEHTPKGIQSEVILHPGVGLPVRTSPDSTATKACQQAFSELSNAECRFILEGASVPIVAALTEASEAEVALIGYGLPTDNMHAPNENFDLKRIETGFITIGRILQILGNQHPETNNETN
jgi:acetylornithine deacetylase/succinyl-diaminopimelate desuccinylase-like protein